MSATSELVALAPGETVHQASESLSICHGVFELMLNVTGGGEKLFKQTHKVFYKTPDLVLHPERESKEKIVSEVESIFGYRN